MSVIRAVSLAVFAALGLFAAALLWFRPVYHNDLWQAGCCLRIAHAGGAVGGVAFTNSAEALAGSLAAGRRVFELDFAELADGSLVLAHDFDDLPAPPADTAAFLAAPEPNGLTRMDLAAFVAWVRANPGVTVITDTKFEGGALRLAAALEAHLPRSDIARQFGFQVYGLDELAGDALRERGYREMLTIYRMADVPEAEIAAAVARHPGLALTMPAWRGPAALRSFRAALPGRPIYLHGDPDDINRQSRQSFFAALGANGFFLE